ncbi:VWA domain-containing protein [Stigmatella sp. ncwal1]|uniref:VWA domain-containing protein n=1 Tax=Stigmatella ashevillensis TaxID=2995309 RepID=A0ABT5DEP8_9BACT|nr:VWA domain-containing protein [Stigmatella ashevillena]MDC0712121.1 VWA domain-containing protein [Stigmatella ashevillena]
MSRTVLLLSAAALLAVGALALGRPPPPPVTDTTHTVALPDEEAATEVLPTVASPETGALSLEGKLSGAWVHAGPSEAFAVLEVKAHAPQERRRVPVNVALVIDRSGSMRGQKLEDAKRAARTFINRVSAEDRVALVHYGTDVTVFPSTLATSEAREQMHVFVNAIEDSGSTHISGGLEAAAQQLRDITGQFRVSRIILLSDGQPTAGLTREEQLTGLARTLRSQGMAVSALGVGEDFNENLMQGIADQGGGFSGFLRSDQLAEVFTRELEQATGTVARAVEVRLDLPPSVREVEVMGVSAVREGRTVRVPLYDMAGGQSARLVVKLSLETKPSEHPQELLVSTVHYIDVEKDGPAQARVTLTARSTEDAQVVRAHLDKDVRVHAHRALGTQQMRAAAEEMKKGNRQGALSLMGNARSLFGASAAALAGDIAELDRSQAAYESAQSASEQRQQARQLQNKSIKNFGQENSY